MGARNWGVSPILLLCSFLWGVVTSYLKDDVVIPFGSRVKSLLSQMLGVCFPSPSFSFDWIVCRYLNFMTFPKILVDNLFYL